MVPHANDFLRAAFDLLSDVHALFKASSLRRPTFRGSPIMRGLGEAIQFPAVAGRTKATEHNETREEALIRQVQARDELAFRQMVERYQSKVFAIIYHILRDRNDVDAEDIAQQVFSKIYFSIRSFDSRSSLSTWIYRITVNECYDYLRKRRPGNLCTKAIFQPRKSSVWKLLGQWQILPRRWNINWWSATWWRSCSPRSPRRAVV